MKDELDLGMFKTYDIRTKEDRLTPSLKERLYNAVAYYYRNIVKADSILISRDARLYVPELAEGLVGKMRECGIDVLYNPLPVSTCQFYYSLMQNRTSGGIMVTASHNPGEYVGLKLLSPSLRPIAYGCGPEGGIAKIRKIYEDGLVPDKEERGRITIVNCLDSFIDYSLSLSGVKPGSLKGLRIMFEFLNGSAGSEIALAFQKAGAEIEVRDITPNGLFPKGDPNPIIESSIAPAREAMKNGSFDFGFCFDGDGDRLDFMTSRGDQMVPGLIMSIIAPEIMKIYGGKKTHFYADVKANPVVLCELARSGADVHMIRNGHSFIKEKLTDNFDKGYIAAEEESAHFYMNFPYDIHSPEKGCAAVESTLFFSLLTARCFMEKREKFAEAEKIQNSLYRYREWPLHAEAAPERLPSLMDEVEEVMRREGAAVIRDMDDGSELDATLFRFNLPLTFDRNSNLDDRKWAQVAQRISRSEDAMARWEVVSNDRDECERLNNLVKSVTDRYVLNGWGRY